MTAMRFLPAGMAGGARLTWAMVEANCVVFFYANVRVIVLFGGRVKLYQTESLVSWVYKVVETRGGEMVVNTRKRGFSQTAR